MKKTLMLATAASLVLAPSLSAQGVGVAARAGTVGIGAEGALGLTDKLVLRGGIGLLPIDVSSEIEDVDFTLSLPDTWLNIGVDVYPTNAFRVGAGMLFKPDEITLEADLTTSVDIGERTFTPAELGTLTGSVGSQDKAPYLLVGFGKHTSLGLGLFVDLGVVFLGDPEIALDASGGTFSDQAELQRQLRIEESNLEAEAGTWLNYWPFLNIGVRFGIG